MTFQNNLTRISTACFLFTALSVFSCKKERSGQNDPSDSEQAALAATEANAEAEMVFNDVFDNVMGVNDEVGMAGTGVFGRYMTRGNTATERPNGCFTVDVSYLDAGNKFPVQITVDFGDNGCEGKDGRVRKGKIISIYTGRLIKPGSSATTIFDNYHIGEIRIEGTQTLTNTSTSGNRQFTIAIENAKLSKPNGDYVAWNNHKIITQTAGLATPLVAADDIFKIEGDSDGQVKKNDLLAVWESEITEPLIKKFLCWWIVQGRLKTVLGAGSSNPWVAELNFGSGTCDRNAVIIINGATHEISLH